MDGSQFTNLSGMTINKTISLGDMGTIAAALVAIAALFLAWGQLRGLSRQTRASLLLTLDERWEGKDLADERKTLLVFKRQVTEEAERETLAHPDRPTTAASLF